MTYLLACMAFGSVVFRFNTHLSDREATTLGRKALVGTQLAEEEEEQQTYYCILTCVLLCCVWSSNTAFIHRIVFVCVIPVGACKVQVRDTKRKENPRPLKFPLPLIVSGFISYFPLAAWDSHPSPGNYRAFIVVSITKKIYALLKYCLLYTSPSPRDRQKYRMPSSA